MLEVLGTAWAYAGSAYSYNMSRFQFDSGQRQAAAHQRQNLRVAQWQLFREDVRDLFQLTTTNMSTYMVVSTLFLGFAVSYLYTAIKDFPPHPPWIMLLWGNCCVASFVYGLLSVWLAMHGTVAAHSASVKVLTQAVRPPIPTADEVAQFKASIGDYEGAGIKKFLQMPDFFGLAKQRAAAEAAARSQDGEGFRTPLEPTGRQLWNSDVMLPHRPLLDAVAEVSEPRSKLTSRRNLGPAAAAQSDGRSTETDSDTLSTGASTNPVRRASAAAAATQERARQLLADEEGGPGRGAASDTHVALFKEMHNTFATFDAYARISLSAAVTNLLLTAAYLSVAHNMLKFDSLNQPVQNKAFAWATMAMALMTAITLYKLDMFVDKSKMRMVKQGVIAGPLCACLAANFWASSRIASEFSVPDLVINVLVFLACVLHFLWNALLLSWAMPDKTTKLPMSFRSVFYLDVFGWFDGFDEEEPQMSAANLRTMAEASVFEDDVDRSAVETQPAQQATSGESECMIAAAHDARALARRLTRLLSSEVVACLSDSELRSLESLRHDMLACSEHIEVSYSDSFSFKGRERAVSSLSDTKLTDSEILKLPWLQCVHGTDMGQEVPYWIHSGTGHVQWEMPTSGQVIDLQCMTQSVQALKERVANAYGVSAAAEASSSALPASSSSSKRASLSNKLQSGARKLATAVGRDLLSEGSGASRDSLPAPARDQAGPDFDLDSTGPALSAAEQAPTPFQPMARRPGSSHQLQSMPWKYFMQICVCNMILWGSTIFWLMFVDTVDEGAPPRIDAKAFSESAGPGFLTSPSAAVRLGGVDWPHKFFRPSAIACAGRTLAVADSFAVHLTEVMAEQGACGGDSGPPQLSSLRRLPLHNVTEPWKSVALACAEDLADEDNRSSSVRTCSALLLSSDGSAVFEQLVVLDGTGPAAVSARRWDLGLMLDSPLQAIAAIGGQDALALCTGRLSLDERGREPDWALYGVVASGEVVSLCPVAGALEPQHVVADLPALHGRGEFLGLHFDGAGAMWLLSLAADGRRAELRVWAGEGASAPRDVWRLPEGRRWAPGLCAAGDGGFLLAGSGSGAGIGARPEVWKLHPEAPTCPALAHFTT